MGLDIYVGPLSRYFSARWELMAERWARDNGETIQILGRPEITPIEPARDFILDWRTSLASIVESGANLEWSEDGHTPYATHKLDDIGQLGVRLLARSELTEKPLPTRLPQSGVPLKDLVTLKSSRYSLIFSQATLFLPGLSEESIVAEDPCGNECPIASVDRLAAQLQDLNSRTLQLVIPNLEPGPPLRDSRSNKKIPEARTLYDANVRVDWFQDAQSTLDVATYGLQVFSCLANYAAKQRLPLVLDS